MAPRGRRSAASLAIVTPFPGGRPPAPDALSDAEAEEWRAVVSRMPADWFTRETQPVLEAFCGHVVSLRTLAERIRHLQAGMSDCDLPIYGQLLTMRERESRAIATLAVKMRLTQQSRYDPAKADRAAKEGAGGGQTSRPWGAAAG